MPKKAVSILPHETKALFVLFCLQLMCLSEGEIVPARVARLAIPWPISKHLAIFEVRWP